MRTSHLRNKKGRFQSKWFNGYNQGSSCTNTKVIYLILSQILNVYMCIYPVMVNVPNHVVYVHYNFEPNIVFVDVK